MKGENLLAGQLRDAEGAAEAGSLDSVGTGLVRFKMPVSSRVRQESCFTTANIYQL